MGISEVLRTRGCLPVGDTASAMAQAVLDNTPAAPLLQSIVGPAPTALCPDIDGVDGFLSIGLATHTRRSELFYLFILNESFKSYSSGIWSLFLPLNSRQIALPNLYNRVELPFRFPVAINLFIA
jgi:hypothetical protein